MPAQPKQPNYLLFRHKIGGKFNQHVSMIHFSSLSSERAIGIRDVSGFSCVQNNFRSSTRAKAVEHLAAARLSEASDLRRRTFATHTLPASGCETSFQTFFGHSGI